MGEQQETIGFIGAGAMARALIGGLLASGCPASRLLATDSDAAQRESIASSYGIGTRDTNASLVQASDTVVLCVKPNVVPQVLQDVSAQAAKPVLWISIAAGVTIAKLESGLGPRARVVRAMPNTPALVRAGATAICGNTAATDADAGRATALFESVGTCWTAPSEDLLDAVTGLSGSGPAYVFVFLEALGDAGVRMGLPRDAAARLAAQTVAGAAKLALASEGPPAALKDQVTSPGGTTIAGLERLEAGGLRAAVHAAVEAATKRSRELGRS